MKSKDFKSLADDTKKMEKNMNIYHMGLIINLIIIAIIAIFVVIVLAVKPEIFSKKHSKASDEANTVQENSTAEDVTSQNKVPFVKFDVKEIDNKYFIVGSNSGSSQKIIEVSKDTYILGVNKNKLYFYDEQGFSYVNFENTNYDKVEWLKYRQYKAANTGETGILNVDKAYLKDDKIYFKYRANIATSSSTSGILSLDISANNFDEAEQILPNVTGNQWVVGQNYIYYVANEKLLCKYDISQKVQETILSDVESIQIEDNKAVYLKLNNAYKESDNAMVHAATYYLYLYDLNTGNNDLVYESSVSNIKNGALTGFAELYKGSVYYKKDNEIYKYVAGENQVIYSDNSSSSYLDSFKVLNDTTIQLNMQGGVKKYLVNGNVVDNI